MRLYHETNNEDGLKWQLSIASTLHCLNSEQVVADWIEEYALEFGYFDITKVDCRLTDCIPSETQMGKVYARLINSVSAPDVSLATTIMDVYSSPICEAIDNYNSSAYYESSYVQTGVYHNGCFA